MNYIEDILGMNDKKFKEIKPITFELTKYTRKYRK